MQEGPHTETRRHRGMKKWGLDRRSFSDLRGSVALWLRVRMISSHPGWSCGFARIAAPGPEPRGTSHRDTETQRNEEMRCGSRAFYDLRASVAPCENNLLPSWLAWVMRCAKWALTCRPQAGIIDSGLAGPQPPHEEREAIARAYWRFRMARGIHAARLTRQAIAMNDRCTRGHAT